MRRIIYLNYGTTARDFIDFSKDVHKTIKSFAKNFSVKGCFRLFTVVFTKQNDCLGVNVTCERNLSFSAN